MRCITLWLGDVKKFEEKVRCEVHDSLVQQLSADFYSYRMCVASTMPVLWVHLDAASASRHHAFELVRGIA